MSTPNVQAVRRVLTVLPRATELLGFPPIPATRCDFTHRECTTPSYGKKGNSLQERKYRIITRTECRRRRGEAIELSGFRREIQRASSQLQISVRALSISPSVYSACAMTGGKQIEFPVPVTY